MTTTLIRPIAVNVNTGALTYEGSIDSSEITDGSITTSDIADGTIAVADMSAAALADRNLFLSANYQ